MELLSERVRLPTARSPIVPAIERALRWVDQSHFVVTVPEIEAILIRTRTTLGWFDPRKRSIGVSVYSQTPELTILHEIGHIVDFWAIEPSGTWSSRSGQLDSLMGLIKESRAFQQLSGVIEGPYPKAVKAYASYLQRDEELFARSYAQYIGELSGDAKMLAYLGAARSGVDQLDRASY
jgi:hypothetical protein